MTTIGILKCGSVPDDLEDRYKDYDQMFMDLLGRELTYRVYDIQNNELPDSATETDGWLITGSKHGVYDDLPWIAPMEQLLRDAYEASVPIVGICFGHQLLAQALGGHVEKFSQGWSVGQVQYQLDGETEPTCINAIHQDQVIEPPAEAESFGSTDFCKHAFLRYGEKALTMQPHPEFNDDFTYDLLQTRLEIITPAGTAEKALQNFNTPLSTKRWADQIRNFLVRPEKS